jgi:hypothetical protein
VALIASALRALPFKPGSLVRLVTPDDAPSRCTKHAMMTRIVARSAAHERAFQTALCVSRHGRGQNECDDRGCGEDFHGPISCFAQAIGTTPKGSFGRALFQRNRGRTCVAPASGRYGPLDRNSAESDEQQRRPEDDQRCIPRTAPRTTGGRKPAPSYSAWMRDYKRDLVRAAAAVR